MKLFTSHIGKQFCMSELFQITSISYSSLSSFFSHFEYKNGVGLKCLATETAGCVALCRNKAGQLRLGPNGRFLQVFNSLIDKNIPSSCLPCFFVVCFFCLCFGSGFFKKHSLRVFGKSRRVLRT